MTKAWTIFPDTLTSKPVIAGVGVSSVFLVLWPLVLGQPAMAASDKSHRCINDADIRLIEVLFSSDGSEPACKVIYRPEAESDTLGTVSWQDLENEAACEAQANEVVGRLTSEGWSCSLIGKAGTAASLKIPDRSEAASDGSTERSEDAAATPLTATAVLEREADPPARLVANKELAPPTDDLTALIEADLGSLDAKLDGRLEAMIAGYGDLNEDEIEDVLVLYTYQSPRPAYRQFLAAYLYDGETYQLTATKPVGGYASGMANAKVEAIDRGVVHLQLQVFEPGDAACCPSGAHHLALSLQNLDFVEIDANGPTR